MAIIAYYKMGVAHATIANQFKEGYIPILNEELWNNTIPSEYFIPKVYKKYTIKSKETRGKNKF